MKKSYKRFIASMLCVILFSLCFGVVAQAKTYGFGNPKVDTYVYDNGNILGGETEKRINDLLVKLEETTDFEFVVYTVPQKGLPDSVSIEDYANDLFNEWGIGKSETDNGILLVISKTDSVVRIETGDGTSGFLTDQKCGKILDKCFVPYREKDDYDNATEYTVNAVVIEIEEESGVEVGANKEAKVEDEGLSDLAMVLITIVAFIVVFILIMSLSDKYGDDSGGYSSDSYYGGGSYSSSGGSFGGGHSSGGGCSR